MGKYLSSAQEAVLLAVVIACDFSVNKRLTMRGLTAKAPKEFQADHKAFRKMVKKLIRKGYIIEQPSGEMTYKITTHAIEYVSSTYRVCQLSEVLPIDYLLSEDMDVG